MAIKVREKPSFPLSGVIATIRTVLSAVSKAPNKSGRTLLKVGCHGFLGRTSGASEIDISPFSLFY